MCTVHAKCIHFDVLTAICGNYLTRCSPESSNGETPPILGNSALILPHKPVLNFRLCDWWSFPRFLELLTLQSWSPVIQVDYILCLKGVETSN